MVPQQIFFTLFASVSLALAVEQIVGNGSASVSVTGVKSTLHRYPSKNQRFIRQNPTPQFSSEILIPQSQSYFIEPETPSTSTVKPNFKRGRAKKSRPLTTVTPQSALSVSLPLAVAPIDGGNSSSNDNEGSTVQSTKRQTRRPFSRGQHQQQKNNNNEGIDNTQNETVKTVPQTQDSPQVVPKKFGRNKNRSPKKIAEPVVKQNTFVPQRRQFGRAQSTPASPTTSPTTFTSTTTSQAIGEPSSNSENGETSPTYGVRSGKRRRVTEGSDADPPPSTPSKPSTPVERKRQRELKKEFVPNGRRAAFSFRNKIHPNLTILNPIEILQEKENGGPLNRRMRHRPAPHQQPQALALTSLPAQLEDSEHQSSDNVHVLSEVEMQQEQPHETEENPRQQQPILPSFPRNLSTRRQSGGPNHSAKLPSSGGGRPLIAPRRFLIPKKKEILLEEQREGEEIQQIVDSSSSTTAKPFDPVSTTIIPTKTSQAPVVATKAPRKSPLSLANLKSRRLGGGTPTSTTTTTTKAPQTPENEESEPVGVEPGSSHIPNESLKNEGEGNSVPEAEAPSPSPPPPTPTAAPALEESGKPLVSGVRNRRPPPRLPGASKQDHLSPSPLIRTGNVLKGKTTEQPTTSPKPSIETTTAPTCEEGKRYNKVLRKCVAPFTPRIG